MTSFRNGLKNHVAFTKLYEINHDHEYDPLDLVTSDIFKKCSLKEARMVKGYKQLVQIIEQGMQAVQIKRDITTTNIAMKLNIWQ